MGVVVGALALCSAFVYCAASSRVLNRPGWDEVMMIMSWSDGERGGVSAGILVPAFSLRFLACVDNRELSNDPLCSSDGTMYVPCTCMYRSESDRPKRKKRC